LYQYLANELNYSHLAVSFIYSSIQFMINFLLLICIKKELISAGVFIVILFTFALIYLFLRDKVIKQLKTENAN